MARPTLPTLKHYISASHRSRPVRAPALVHGVCDGPHSANTPYTYTPLSATHSLTRSLLFVIFFMPACPHTPQQDAPQTTP